MDRHVRPPSNVISAIWFFSCLFCKAVKRGAWRESLRFKNIKMQPYNTDLSWIDRELKDILHKDRTSILTKGIDLQYIKKTRN
jgi:hypothetical protein